MSREQHNVATPILTSLLIITLGCFIFAVGFNIFIFPLKILTGGVTGISVIFSEAFGFAPAYTQWALNIPTFFLGWIVIGHEYAFKIIYGSFFLPYAIILTEGLGKFAGSNNQLTSVIIGALLLGLGLGLILDANGSTGGLDIPARIISRRFNIGLGLAIGLIDLIVIVVGMIAFEWMDGTGLIKGFYALVVVFFMTLMIDLVTIKKPGHNILRSALKSLTN